MRRWRSRLNRFLICEAGAFPPQPDQPGEPAAAAAVGVDKATAAEADEVTETKTQTGAQARPASTEQKRLKFPKVSDPAAPPLRPERRVTNSLTTIRRQITKELARLYQRCPCCHRDNTL
ncbi:MAG: hypothetical protein AAFW82_00065 [Pseudomonadota bacterium]